MPEKPCNYGQSRGVTSEREEPIFLQPSGGQVQVLRRRLHFAPGPFGQDEFGRGSHFGAPSFRSKIGQGQHTYEVPLPKLPQSNPAPRCLEWMVFGGDHAPTTLHGQPVRLASVHWGVKVVPYPSTDDLLPPRIP